MIRVLTICLLVLVSGMTTAQVVIELTHPVGKSPRVFTEGWVFGAKASVNGKDVSQQVKWSGTGKFTPASGSSSRPRFNAAGTNSITLSLTAGGKKISKSFSVQAVSPANYASVGSIAYCPADSHPDALGTVPVSGPILTGSETVLVNGRPAARKGDTGIHATCSGDNTFEIVEGDANVLIDGRPAARFGDRTRHCGGEGQIVKNRPALPLIALSGTLTPPIKAGPTKFALVPDGSEFDIKGFERGVSPMDKSVTFEMRWNGRIDREGKVTGSVTVKRIATKSMTEFTGVLSGTFDRRKGLLNGTVTFRIGENELKSALSLVRTGQ